MGFFNSSLSDLFKRQQAEWFWKKPKQQTALDLLTDFYLESGVSYSYVETVESVMVLAFTERRTCLLGVFQVAAMVVSMYLYCYLDKHSRWKVDSVSSTHAQGMVYIAHTDITIHVMNGMYRLAVNINEMKH